MDLTDAFSANNHRSDRARLARPTIEREGSGRPPYSVTFSSVDRSVPSDSAVRLLSRFGGAKFRAFNGDLNADRSTYENCSARDFDHADFIIYLHDAMAMRHSADLPRDVRSLHWHITGLSASSDPKEKERSLLKMEMELETRIKLLIVVYEREYRKERAISLPSSLDTGDQPAPRPY